MDAFKPSFTSAHMLLDKAVTKRDHFRFMIPGLNGNWIGITWKEFFEYTESIAYFLHQLGIGKGRKVSIFAKTRVEWAYCGVAIQCCRAVFVPVYHSSTRDQVKYIVNHSDSKILITELDLLPIVLDIFNEIPLIKKIIIVDLKNEDQLYDELREPNKKRHGKLDIAAIREKVISLVEIYSSADVFEKNSSFSLNNLVQQIREDDTAAILYTSGTTGPPKGVVLTNENLLKNAEDWIEVLGPLIPEKRVDLLWLPTSHIFGWGELGLGHTLDFITYFTNPRDVLSLMPEVRPTIFMSVPAYWEKLYLQAKAWSEQLDEQRERLLQLTGGELRFCLSGGAGLKKEVKAFYLKAGLLIIEGYGLTECSPTLTMNRKDDFDFDTVGKPFPRVQLKLASDGEILAKGPNVFKGYYKDPESTKQAFDKEGWFKTGDLGAWTDRGFLIIKGRKKDIIITSGGKNISPQFIECKFNDDPYIEHVVLYGNNKKYLTALVTLKEHSIVDYAKAMNIEEEHYLSLIRRPEIVSLIRNRMEQINKELASFETIKKFYIYEGHLTMEAGFLTPSLKLKRNKVYESFQDRLEALYEEK